MEQKCLRLAGQHHLNAYSTKHEYGKYFSQLEIYTYLGVAVIAWENELLFLPKQTFICVNILVIRRVIDVTATEDQSENRGRDFWNVNFGERKIVSE